MLLYLVRKNELDIQNIPIIVITQQYMQYIELMQTLNLDVAGEFLVMAATLMHLKSRALLPHIDEEEAEEGQETLDDLKRQLLEYQQYREAAIRLKEQNILEKDVFTRSYFEEPVSDDGEDLQEASLFDLLNAFNTMLKRSDDAEAVYHISPEEISVKDKINDVLQRIEGSESGLEFVNLFSENASKVEIITTFLALLELIKMQAIKLYQNSTFSRIYIHPVHDDEQAQEQEHDVQPE
ncbi:MAG: segregation/condensation protein A [Deltaproteobacteria bacterium]|nr:segregation/condensation protein A [Deltaproteobacteria bacterium]